MLIMEKLCSCFYSGAVSIFLLPLLVINDEQKKLNFCGAENSKAFFCVLICLCGREKENCFFFQPVGFLLMMC